MRQNWIMVVDGQVKVGHQYDSLERAREEAETRADCRGETVFIYQLVGAAQVEPLPRPPSKWVDAQLAPGTPRDR